MGAGSRQSVKAVDIASGIDTLRLGKKRFREIDRRESALVENKTMEGPFPEVGYTSTALL